MTTIETLKSQAKLLRAHLSANNTPLTHSQSIEAVAVINGYRDWNTANAALSKAKEPSSALLISVVASTSPEKLRADFQTLWRRKPVAIRVRFDTGVTDEQVRLARILANEFEQVGVKVEFDLPV